AAETLINKQEEKYYTASIHHAYYAVFQYMKYVLAHTDMQPLSYEEQTEKSGGKGSHKYLINQIKQRINNSKKARKFVQAVRELKEARVDADYRIRQFTQEESLACKQQAEELITKLIMYFGDL
ncbi:hypothetical protein BHU16_10080, partial [Tannerella sp. oral taxon 808]